MTKTRRMLDLSDETWRRIDDYRFSHRIDKRPDALRKLLDIALDLVEAEAKSTAA